MTSSPIFRRVLQRIRQVGLPGLLVLGGCMGMPAIDESRTLARAGQHEQSLTVLSLALERSPNDASLRVAERQQREVVLAQRVAQADSHLKAGRAPEAAALLERARTIDPGHARVATLAADIERLNRRDQALTRARAAEASGRLDEARNLLQPLLDESPSHPGARALQLRLQERRARPPAAAVLGPAFATPVTLEFRDAPLRSVFEGLGRTHGINFVFDRDVRTDTRISVLLRDVSVADALAVILNTQMLASKTLNDRTLLIYPNTQAKQREHQELVTRSFYLVNADVKQAQAMVRTMAKTRDIYVDERLNQLVVRDTPDVLRMVERLLASIDIAEPEVLLEVEVLEVTNSQLDEMGLQWPEQVSYGLLNGSAQVEVGQRGSFRASIVNPAVLATLRETTSRANTLANPRLRARNREKAKVMVGEKLPVFTTTSTANVGVSASVSYLDVGLKLEVEPNVQLDNDVVMKVNLEVSTLIGRVAGPQGSVGYQVGTRQASTSLRLRDGETQILAGLIRDEDSKGVAGLPGLSALPLVGRLFGLHTDQRQRSEIVLLITPRVVRSLAIPDAAVGPAAAGIDANPGAPPLRLAAGAAVAVPPASGGVRSAAGGQVPASSAAAGRVLAPEKIATLQLASSGQIDPGGTAAITLRNGSDTTLQGELVFDSTLLQPAQTGTGSAGVGRVPFTLNPGAELAVMLRATAAAAAGTTLSVAVSGLVATDATGEAVAVQVAGDVNLAVGRR